MKQLKSELLKKYSNKKKNKIVRKRISFITIKYTLILIFVVYFDIFLQISEFDAVVYCEQLNLKPRLLRELKGGEM